jgi:hypothetical protein
LKSLWGQGVHLSGEIHSLEDLHANLTTADQDEVQKLIARHNQIFKMPNVDRAKKAEIENAAQENLTLAKRSYDATQNRLEQLNRKVTEDSLEIEKLKPKATELRTAAENQRVLTRSATAEEAAILVKKGARIGALKWVRRGLYFYGAFDVLGRLFYLGAVNQDPGMFPVFRILHVY